MNISIINMPTLRKAFAFVAMLALVLTSVQTAFVPSAHAAALPNNVTITQWSDSNSNWITGALNSNNSEYTEGEVVPFRLDLNINQVEVDDEFTFSVCRDYINGSVYGYDELMSFDTNRNPVVGASITSSLDSFSGANVTIVSVDELGQGSCAVGARQTEVTVVVDAKPAYVLWGGHLASPDDVGEGNGASSWNGANLHMRLLSPNKDLPIQTSAIEPLIPDPVATLTIVKDVEVADGASLPAEWSFDFTHAEGSPFTLTQADAQEVLSGEIVGEHNFTEDTPLPADWYLTEVTCDGGDWESITNGFSIVLVDGDDVTCTFTNTYRPEQVGESAKLTIVKEVEAADSASLPGTWSFDFDHAEGTEFTLDDENTSKEFSGAIVGEHNFTEVTPLPADWYLTGVVCEGLLGNQWSVDSETDELTVTLVDEDEATCTFTNTYRPTVDPELGSISGTKSDFDTQDGLSGWTIFIDENDNQALDDGEESVVTDVNGNYTFINVEDGTYDVCEVMQTGWEQTSPDTANGCHEVTIIEGSVVEDINFVNRQLPSETIEICKFDENEQPIEGWGMTLTNDDDVTFELETGENGCVSQAVNPEDGPFFVTEEMQANWTQVDVSADFGDVIETQEEGVFMCRFFEPAEQEQEVFLLAVIDEEPEFRCNFMNEEDERDDSSTSGGGGSGGGSSAPRCDMFEAEIDGDEIVLTWETRRGTGLTIEADGDEIFSTTNDDEIDEGSLTVDNDGQEEFELVVSRGSREDDCSVNINRPTPQVLGDQVSIVPLGAANTGAGGTSPMQTPQTPFATLVGALSLRRNG